MPPPRLPSNMPGLPAGLPNNIGKRLKLLGAAVVGFYTLPIAVIGTVGSIVGAFEDPKALIGLLKVLPLAALGAGAVFVFLRMRRELADDEEQRTIDAKRTEARMRAQGKLQGHARAIVAGTPADAPTPARPMPMTARIAPVAAPPTATPPAVEGRFAGALDRTERVRCVWCGQWVSIALADAATGDVTCPSCTTTFSMRGELHKAMGMRPQPMGLEVQTYGNNVVIQHKTNPGAGCGLVMAMGVIFLLTLPDGLNRGQWTPTVLTSIAFAVVLVVTRAWAARTTEYSITDTNLTVRIHGLPARVLGEWNPLDIDQVFVRTRYRTERRKKRYNSNKTKRVKVPVYDLILRQTDDKEVRLAQDLSFLEWALYIEQEIENRMGIEDRAMGKNSPSR